MTNGMGKASISEYLIVVSNGLTMIGRPHAVVGEDDLFELAPVYQFHSQLMAREVRPGVVAASWAYQAFPIYGLTSFARIKIPGASCLAKEVGTLSDVDQRSLAKAVEDCEENIRRQEMAQRTGLDLSAGSMR